MKFFKRSKEANRVREILSPNGLPVDEIVFCSALSNGRARSFEKLTMTEFKDLERLLNGFSHEQLLEGIYSIAVELKVVAVKVVTKENDQSIIDYLKEFKMINPEGQFKLNNLSGNVITFKAPLKTLSYYSLSCFSHLFGQLYCIRSSALN